MKNCSQLTNYEKILSSGMSQSDRLKIFLVKIFDIYKVTTQSVRNSSMAFSTECVDWPITVTDSKDFLFFIPLVVELDPDSGTLIL